MSDTPHHGTSRRSRLPTPIRVAIAGAALLAAPAWADAVRCTNGSLTRSIEVVYSNPGQPVPCEVIYDKSAEGAGQHSLWRAGSEAGYCEAQAAAFVDKLRSAGWTCDGTDAAPAADAPADAPMEMLGEPG